MVSGSRCEPKQHFIRSSRSFFNTPYFPSPHSLFHSFSPLERALRNSKPTINQIQVRTWKLPVLTCTSTHVDDNKFDHLARPLQACMCNGFRGIFHTPTRPIWCVFLPTSGVIDRSLISLQINCSAFKPWQTCPATSCGLWVVAQVLRACRDLESCFGAAVSFYFRCHLVHIIAAFMLLSATIQCNLFVSICLQSLQDSQSH